MQQPSKFDIYHLEGTGETVWLGLAVSLDAAQRLIESLPTDKPRSYLIVSLELGSKTLFTYPQSQAATGF